MFSFGIGAAVRTGTILLNEARTVLVRVRVGQVISLNAKSAPRVHLLPLNTHALSFFSA
jgi:hypothetical protein